MTPVPWASKARGSSISGLTRSVNIKWNNNAQSILQILFFFFRLGCTKARIYLIQLVPLTYETIERKVSSLFGPLHYHVVDTFQSAVCFFHLSLCLFLKFHKQPFALECIRNKLSLVTHACTLQIFCSSRCMDSSGSQLHLMKCVFS